MRGALVIAAVVAGCAHNPPPPSAPVGFGREVVPLIGRYCGGCHGADRHRGDVRLDRYRDVGDARADRETWAAVLEQLGSEQMPPDGKPQPTPAERALLLATIERDVLGCDCAHPDPGRVTARRLNRAEYDNTIRDLLGVDLSLATDFPVDDPAFGFDTVADALSISPALAAKYLTAAHVALDAVLPPPELRVRRARRFPVDLLEVGYNAHQTGDGLALLNSFEEDDVAAVVEVPFEADYLMRVRAHALNDATLPAKYPRADGPVAVTVTFLVDERAVGTAVVAATREMPAIYDVRARVPAGRHRLRAAVARKREWRAEAESPGWKKAPQQPGSVAVEWLELDGPLDADGGPARASRARLFAGVAGRDELAARAVLARFARRAFRRPATPDELTGLTALAASAWRRGADFEQGVRVALEAILVSPAFLFRQGPPARGGAQLLDEHALASRLSYFLWSTTPDELLLADADRGALRAHLDAHVSRMLRDRRARALTDGFAGQWLQIRNLEQARPDVDSLKGWDEPLRTAMRRETELFFSAIVAEDRSVLEFLDADWTFVDERLARHYGIAGVTGEGFRRVSLRDTPRRGVITHASVLTLTSNPTRTSPVKRGRWVLEALLNAPPPPPPPDVPQLEERREVHGTLRERLEQHRADPACAGCHARMDPLGFALERFDAIGAWRADDHGAPIDARGTLPSGESFEGAAGLAALLGHEKHDQFVRALASRMLTYALGRGLAWYDRCAVDEIVRRLTGGGYRFSALVRAIVASAPFQGAGGAAGPVASR